MANKKRKSYKKRERTVAIPRLNLEDARTEKILIENFVALQKVMATLSERFDSLATQISKMLNLFEISAKALAEKDFSMEKDNKDLKRTVEKLDGLLEQNKVIARGLTLLHEEISPTSKPEPPQVPQEVSAFSQAPPPMPNLSSERYQKSISSEEAAPQGQPQPKFKPLPR